MPPESMPGMRPIAITAQHRSLALPLTPTFAETGMNIITGSYLGLTMASSVPEPVRASVAAQTAAALSDEKLRYSLATSGATLVLLDYDKIDAFMDCRRREAGQFMEDYPLLPAGTR